MSKINFVLEIVIVRWYKIFGHETYFDRMSVQFVGCVVKGTEGTTKVEEFIKQISCCHCLEAVSSGMSCAWHQEHDKVNQFLSPSRNDNRVHQATLPYVSIAHVYG